MAKYVAAVDQGTTSTRCMLFNHSGGVVSVAQKEHEQIYPQAGWVEHDPMEIWERSQEVVKEAVAAADAQPGDIAAVGITNQRETTVVWDKNTGKPYYNAIVWQDTRTDRIINRLGRDGGQERFRPKVGLPLATYFSGPKVMWILENVDGVREAAESGDAIFGNIDTWLIWWLTGGPDGGSHVTDVTNASRTMLMNLETLDWDDEILQAMNIPRQMMPRIVPSSDPETWGNTKEDGPFGEAIPVSGDLGDQQAALVGQTCYSVGEAKNTYGTGCFMLINTGTKPVPSESGLLTTLGYKIGDRPAVYALEGSIAITGALVQWLRDNLNFYDFSHHIEDYAQEVDDAGGIYFVPAFSGLFAPYWQSDARGVIVGLTRYINKNHIARAALEATAYQTREVLDAMEKDSGVELKALKVDGGMVYNELLMQFQADILGVPVIRPVVSETTALGAAYAAGLAVGFWNDLEDLRENWQIAKTWEPEMGADERQKLYKGWLKAVQRTMNWVENDED
ncbi:MAG TPA: glycerol kinase GlpK [Candidatus Sulfomarinibacteraceae bacterium]|nr:glycerol kinase GlpK [Candidatus Sulfomarinibacteraceae bacterium]